MDERDENTLSHWASLKVDRKEEEGQHLPATSWNAMVWWFGRVTGHNRTEVFIFWNSFLVGWCKVRTINSYSNTKHYEWFHQNYIIKLMDEQTKQKENKAISWTEVCGHKIKLKWVGLNRPTRILQCHAIAIATREPGHVWPVPINSSIS